MSTHSTDSNTASLNLRNETYNAIANALLEQGIKYEKATVTRIASLVAFARDKAGDPLWGIDNLGIVCSADDEKTQHNLSALRKLEKRSRWYRFNDIARSTQDNVQWSWPLLQFHTLSLGNQNRTVEAWLHQVKNGNKVDYAVYILIQKS